MRAKRADLIVFKLDTGEKKTGLVLSATMGIYSVMTKDGDCRVKERDVTENKGSIFE